MKITKRQLKRIIQEESYKLREDHIADELEHLRKNIKDDEEHIDNLEKDIRDEREEEERAKEAEKEKNESFKFSRRRLRKIIREELTGDNKYGKDYLSHTRQDGEGELTDPELDYDDDKPGDLHIHVHQESRRHRKQRIMKRHLQKIIREELFKEDKSGKGQCPDSGCIKKSGKDWRIISNKTGKLWPQKYKSKKSASDALEAYHANR